MAVKTTHLAIVAFVMATCFSLPSNLFGQPATQSRPAETTPTPDEKAEQAAETQVQEQAKSKTKAKKKKPSEHFMRIRKNARGKLLALETSITRYELTNAAGEPVTVDLIGAVHVGEKEYYEDLNERFEKYDSMLYELVAPEGTVIPKGGRQTEGIPLNPLAAMQMGMKETLGLEFQLDLIDYNKDNFKHADMSPEEFSESMVENDESLMKYGLKAIGQSMAMQAAGGQSADSMGMLMAAFSSNKEMHMRRMFAKQIKQMEAGMVIFQGKDGSTIVTHRNAKCMEVLKEEIAAGKTNLAIFYGAAHLPDMERRMLSDFKAKRAGQVWLEAWRLTE